MRTTERVFTCFERFFANRYEEVNNYSGWMTRSFYERSGRFAYRSVDTPQDRLEPTPRIAGGVQADTIDGEVLGMAGKAIKLVPASLASSGRIALERFERAQPAAESVRWIAGSDASSTMPGAPALAPGSRAKAIACDAGVGRANT